MTSDDSSGRITIIDASWFRRAQCMEYSIWALYSVLHSGCFTCPISRQQCSNVQQPLVIAPARILHAVLFKAVCTPASGNASLPIATRLHPALSSCRSEDRDVERFCRDYGVQHSKDTEQLEWAYLIRLIGRRILNPLMYCWMFAAESSEDVY